MSFDGTMKQAMIILGISWLATSVLKAEDWPQFRGPNAQGRSAESNLPVQWSATDNIAWKTPIPGESWSSPIVWGNHVFLTSAMGNGESCHVIAIDRNSGKILWDKEVFKQALRRKEGRNTFATPTPATDGEKVYACFYDGSFAALSFSGDLVWTNRSYPFYSQHGLATSPILYGGLLIMARDGSSDGPDKTLGWQKPWDQAYIVALDTKTGHEKWKARRGLSRISHCVPTIWHTPEGQIQVISEAGDVVQGFDFHSGKRIWSSEVIGEGKVPSTVIGDGLVFTAGGWGGKETIKAFKLGGSGDLGETNLVWQQKKGLPKIPSMLFVNSHLFAVTENGLATCMDAKNGEILWQERMGSRFSASPVWAENRIYFLSDDGITTVIEDGREFKVIAKNPLDEMTQASMAVSQGQLFIRTEKHLYCIGKR